MNNTNFYVDSPEIVQVGRFDKENKSEPDRIQEIKDLNSKGEAFFNDGNLDDAFKLFKKALQLKPDHADTLNNLGVLYWANSDIKNALRSFKKAIDNDPKNRDALFNYIDVSNKTGQKANAISLLETYLNFHPDDEEFLAIRQNLKDSMGRESENEYEYKVSVIIPCYNYGRFLRESVGSALAQTYDDYEIIIVNDGSTDDSAEVAGQLISKNNRIPMRLIDQENSGQPAISRNNGIKSSKGEYIICLDADDMMDSSLLEECVNVLDANPKAALVYPDQVHFENGKAKLIHSQEWNDKLILQTNLIPTCCMFRKKVWEEAGGYKTNVIGYEDWDLWITIGGDLKYPVIRIPKPFFYYRVNHSGVFADASERDTELRAQIILNHPGLYGEEAVSLAQKYFELKKQKEWAFHLQKPINKSMDF